MQHKTLNFCQLNFLSESVCWASLEKDFGEVNWELLMKDCDPEARYDRLITICLGLSEKKVPLRRSTNKTVPYKGNIPRDRKVLRRKKNKEETKNY